MWDHF